MNVVAVTGCRYWHGYLSSLASFRDSSAHQNWYQIETRYLSAAVAVAVAVVGVA